MASEAQRYERVIDREVVKALGVIPLLVPILEEVGLREIVGRHLVSVNDVDNGTVALALCLNRLLAPKPLDKVETWVADTVLPDYLGVEASKLHDDRLGRFLDDLAPHLEEIWQALCLRALVRYQVDLSVILYDLTSFYFEDDDTENPAVTDGYSRDHRPDTKQWVVGLNVTGTDGVPGTSAPLDNNRCHAFTEMPPEPVPWLFRTHGESGGRVARTRARSTRPSPTPRSSRPRSAGWARRRPRPCSSTTCRSTWPPRGSWACARS